MTIYNDNYEKTFPFSDTARRMELAAGVPLSYTVPGPLGQRYRAEFATACVNSVWVALNQVAVVPAPGTISDSYNQELICCDMARYVKAGDTLSFISSAGTPQVNVRLLQLPSPTL